MAKTTSEPSSCLEEGVSGTLELGMVLLAVHNLRSPRRQPVRHPPELLPRAGGYVTEIVWYDHVSRWIYHSIGCSASACVPSNGCCRKP